MFKLEDGELKFVVVLLVIGGFYCEIVVDVIDLSELLDKVEYEVLWD